MNVAACLEALADAVRCAVEVQQGMAGREPGVTEGSGPGT